MGTRHRGITSRNDPRGANNHASRSSLTEYDNTVALFSTARRCGWSQL